MVFILLVVIVHLLNQGGHLSHAKFAGGVLVWVETNFVNPTSHQCFARLVLAFNVWIKDFPVKLLTEHGILAILVSHHAILLDLCLETLFHEVTHLTWNHVLVREEFGQLNVIPILSLRKSLLLSAHVKVYHKPIKY